MNNFWDIAARDGRMYGAWGSVAAAAANQSYIGIFAAANKELYIKRAIFFHPNATPFQLSLGMTDSSAGLTAGNAGSCFKTAGADSASTIFSRNNSTAAPSGFKRIDKRYLEGYTTAGGGGVCGVFRFEPTAPIVLNAGQGFIGYSDGTNNVNLEAYFEFVER